VIIMNFNELPDIDSWKTEEFREMVAGKMYGLVLVKRWAEN